MSVMEDKPIALMGLQWEFIEVDLMAALVEFFHNGVVNVATNETYVSLIPKKFNS